MRYISFSPAGQRYVLGSIVDEALLAEAASLARVSPTLPESG
jgi:hypothetical protein